MPADMSSEQHISKQFDAELEHVRAQVLAMGQLVERQVTMALASLQQEDGSLAERVVTREAEVNGLESSLDELCATVIARRQPASNDLRLLTMVLKTITDLERIGDEAKKIALIARAGHGRPPGASFRLPEIPLMGEMATDMVGRAMLMFKHLDLDPGPELVRRDQELDAHFQGALRQLLTYMIEDPRTISAALDAIFVVKSLERVGDHARNISEYVVYMIKGRDVRHLSIEELERAVRE